MVASSRRIEMVVAARAEGLRAFQEARSEMQSLLAQSREANRRLNPFGQLVAGAEARDAAAAAQREQYMRQEAEAAAKLNRDQLAMMAELTAARDAARSRDVIQAQQAAFEEARAAATAKELEAQQKLEIEDRLYALTHARRDVELRHLDQYYAVLRRKHADNAEMLALIDKTYAAERNSILGQNRQGFVGKGGKEAVNQNATFLASSVMGSTGGAIGMAVNNVFAFGLTGGAIAGAFMLANASIKKTVESAEQLRQIVAELAVSAKRFGEVLLGDAPTTGRGDRLRQAEKELEAERDKAAKQRSELENDTLAKGRSWVSKQFHANSALGQVLDKLGYNGDDYDVRVGMAADMEQRSKDNLDKVRKQLREQKEMAEARRAAADAATVEAARIGAMVDGPEKQRLELLHRQAQERRKAAEANQDKAGSVNEQAIAARQAIERAALERRLQDEITRERAGAQEMRLGLMLTGIERERALLAHKHQQELAEYQRSGRDAAALLERQSLEREAIQRGVQERNRGLAIDAGQAQLALIKDQGQRELAQLTLRHRLELEEARKAGLDTSLVAAKQAAEMQALQDSLAGAEQGRTAPRSVGFVDAQGWASAPREFFFQPNQKEDARQNKLVELNSESNQLLKQVIEAINSKTPQLARM